MKNLGLIISGLALVLMQSSIASAENEGEKIKKQFTMFMGGKPMRRPVFAKAHACLKGEFIVNDGLDENLRVGVFAEKSFPAIVRFSNDGPPRPDQEGSARGMAIKLLGVKGPKLLDGENEATTQDFIMQNWPIFFADNAEQFFEFTQAIIEGRLDAWFETNKRNKQILEDIKAQDLRDPLDGTYWTPTPYRLGATPMKYMVEPVECKCDKEPCGKRTIDLSKPNKHKHFLKVNMAEHIKNQDACFSFSVQLFSNEHVTPIDHAMTAWTTPFTPVAKLVLKKGQAINVANDKEIEKVDEACDSLSYNPWHAIAEHEPLGTINAARKVVYKGMADIRRTKNQVPLKEPVRE